MAVINSPTFHRFPDLPPEIRIQIWQDALPDTVKPALYLYRKGCWAPRHLTEADEDFDPENDECNLNLEFNPQWLEGGEYNLPLAFVNREARRAALAWVQDERLEVGHRVNPRRPVFTRPFNPLCDALYVPADAWDDFIEEPMVRREAPDLLEQMVGIQMPVGRIAISDKLLQRNISSPCELYVHYFQVTDLFVIPSPPLELESGNQRQLVWEYEGLSTGAHLWNYRSRKFTIDMDGGLDENEPTFKLMKKAAKRLRGKLGSEGIASCHFQQARVSARG